MSLAVTPGATMATLERVQLAKCGTVTARAGPAVCLGIRALHCDNADRDQLGDQFQLVEVSNHRRSLTNGCGLCVGTATSQRPILP